MKNWFDWLFHYIHRHSTISINTTQLKDIDMEFQFHYCNIVTRNVGFKNGFDPRMRRMRNEFLKKSDDWNFFVRKIIIKFLFFDVLYVSRFGRAYVATYISFEFLIR